MVNVRSALIQVTLAKTVIPQQYVDPFDDSSCEDEYALRCRWWTWAVMSAGQAKLRIEWGQTIVIWLIK